MATYGGEPADSLTDQIYGGEPAISISEKVYGGLNAKDKTTMATYTGYRPILPQRNVNDMKHHTTGEVGTYSNWSLMSSTQPLEDMPLHESGEGPYAHDSRLAQQFRGEFEYKPMELSKYSHGGQRAAYLRHAPWEFHGVPAADIFPRDFGHDGTREFTFSRYSNNTVDGVPSATVLEDVGHEPRDYDSAIANHGPTTPYEHRGVGEKILADPGNEDAGTYGSARVNEYFGVPSAKAL